MWWENEHNLLNFLNFCDKLLLHSNICCLAVNIIKIILLNIGKKKIISKWIKIRYMPPEGHFESWLFCWTFFFLSVFLGFFCFVFCLFFFFFFPWMSSETNSNSILDGMTRSSALSSTTVNITLLEETWDSDHMWMYRESIMVFLLPDGVWD